MHCPACAHDNIDGADQCAHCGLDLAGLDVGAWRVSPQDPLLTRTLASLPLKPPLTLRPGASIADAVRLMTDRDEGCVFVLDERERLIGVLTERDVALRVVARGRSADQTRLAEVMTPNPFFLLAEDALTFALHRMGVDGFRHIPVLDGQKLIGFLSMRTVLEVLAEP